MRHHLRLLAAAAVLAACTSGNRAPAAFDPAEIRAAERALIAALESPDTTAWVYHYTEDATFTYGTEEPVSGRPALLAMARAMPPMSSVAITPLHTEGSGSLAYVYATGSWVSGRAPQAVTSVHVRDVLIWRKEADGRWRIVQEAITPIGQPR